MVVIGLLLALTACARPPEAEFTISASTGEAPITVQFTNLSKNAETFQWDFGDGATAITASEEDLVTHEYTKAGTHTVNLTAIKQGEPPQTNTVTITIEPGPLDHVKLEPATAVVEVSKQQQFTVSALDQFGNEIRGLRYEWSASSGGIVDSIGRFTAGVAAGTFQDALQVKALQGDIRVEATASVRVEPGSLHRLVLEPGSVEMNIGDSQGFTAKAFDQFANEIRGLTFEWETTAAVGAVDTGGLFTAGTKAGFFSGAVLVMTASGPIVKTVGAQVTIRPDPVFAVQLEPTYIVMDEGTAQRFAAAGLDRYGNIILGLAFLWKAKGGNIDQRGLFVPNLQSEQHEVTASATFRSTEATGSLVFDQVVILKQEVIKERITEVPLEIVVLKEENVSVVEKEVERFLEFHDYQGCPEGTKIILVEHEAPREIVVIRPVERLVEVPVQRVAVNETVIPIQLPVGAKIFVRTIVKEVEVEKVVVVEKLVEREVTQERLLIRLKPVPTACPSGDQVTIRKPVVVEIKREKVVEVDVLVYVEKVIDITVNVLKEELVS